MAEDLGLVSISLGVDNDLLGLRKVVVVYVADAAPDDETLDFLKRIGARVDVVVAVVLDLLVSCALLQCARNSEDGFP